MKRLVPIVLASLLVFSSPALAEEVDTLYGNVGGEPIGQVEFGESDSWASDGDPLDDGGAGSAPDIVGDSLPDVVEAGDDAVVSAPDEPLEAGEDPDPSDPADLGGWQEADGARFYVDPETGERLAGGVFEIEGESYCFGPDGALVTGWMAIDGDVYYFDPESGAMLSGCEAVIRGLCAPISASGGASFSDVSGSTPHAGDILWTYESGVSTGWVSPC